MTDFFVKYEGNCCVVSRVYAIDSTRHEFLIVDDDEYYGGQFMWVPTRDCKLLNKADVEDFEYDRDNERKQYLND